MNNYKIEKYNDNFKNALLTVWENSVLATHHFLSKSDFREIKKLVTSINFNDLEVYCLTNNQIVLGFIGVEDKKLEMLFLDPKYFGQRLGFKLLDFAVKKLNANKVDVNEQNTKSVIFYKKYGFKTFARTDKDDQGRDYPLLKMELIKPF